MKLYDAKEFLFLQDITYDVLIAKLNGLGEQFGCVTVDHLVMKSKEEGRKRKVDYAVVSYLVEDDDEEDDWGL